MKRDEDSSVGQNRGVLLDQEIAQSCYKEEKNKEVNQRLLVRRRIQVDENKM